MEPEEEKMVASFDAAFAHHVIVPTIAAGRWKMRTASGSSAFWFDVLALDGGALLVHGDIELVVFGQFRPGTREDHPLSIVRWIGENRSIGYVAEKARIGMGLSRDVLEDFSNEKAVRDVEALILASEDDPARHDVLKNALDHHPSDMEHYLRSEEAIDGPIGYHVSTRVVCAWRAVAALCRELRKAG